GRRSSSGSKSALRTNPLVPSPSSTSMNWASALSVPVTISLRANVSFLAPPGASKSRVVFLVRNFMSASLWKVIQGVDEFPGNLAVERRRKLYHGRQRGTHRSDFGTQWTQSSRKRRSPPGGRFLELIDKLHHAVSVSISAPLEEVLRTP